MPPETLRLREQLKAFFQDKPVLKAELFGSCARGDQTAASDVDLLVTPSPEATRRDLFRIAGEVEDLLGRKIDFLLRPSVEAMRNPKARDLILNSAVTVYVA